MHERPITHRKQTKCYNWFIDQIIIIILHWRHGSMNLMNVCMKSRPIVYEDAFRMRLQKISIKGSDYVCVCLHVYYRRRLRGELKVRFPKNLRWGGQRDGPCIRPPNIWRSSVIGSMAKYKQTKKGGKEEIYFWNRRFSSRKGSYLLYIRCVRQQRQAKGRSIKKVIRKFGLRKLFPPAPKLGAKSPPMVCVCVCLYCMYSLLYFRNSVPSMQLLRRAKDPATIGKKSWVNNKTYKIKPRLESKKTAGPWGPTTESICLHALKNVCVRAMLHIYMSIRRFI